MKAWHSSGKNELKNGWGLNMVDFL